jgi:membrane-anchored protein YejM (alkaline phosphatase superfamily)
MLSCDILLLLVDVVLSRQRLRDCQRAVMTMIMSMLLCTFMMTTIVYAASGMYASQSSS